MKYITIAATLFVAAFAKECEQPLLDPVNCCTFTAPDTFSVTFNTTITPQSTFTIFVNRSFGPIGVDRFYSLSKCHYFDSKTDSTTNNNAGFFRVVPQFVVQWGIAGDPAVANVWGNLIIDNDNLTISNTYGTIAYAAASCGNDNMACNRTTQVYVNYADNSRLDGMGFTPFGIISTTDMSVVNSIYSGYGQNPDQDSIYAQGDVYLQENFPQLDYIIDTIIVDNPTITNDMQIAINKAMKK